MKNAKRNKEKKALHSREHSRNEFTKHLQTCMYVNLFASIRNQAHKTHMHGNMYVYVNV